MHEVRVAFNKLHLLTAKSNKHNRSTSRVAKIRNLVWTGSRPVLRATMGQVPSELSLFHFDIIHSHRQTKAELEISCQQNGWLKDHQANSAVRASGHKIYRVSGKNMSQNRKRPHALTHVWKTMVLSTHLCVRILRDCLSLGFPIILHVKSLISMRATCPDLVLLSLVVTIMSCDKHK